MSTPVFRAPRSLRSSLYLCCYRALTGLAAGFILKALFGRAAFEGEGR